MAISSAHLRKTKPRAIKMNQAVGTVNSFHEPNQKQPLKPLVFAPMLGGQLPASSPKGVCTAHKLLLHKHNAHCNNTPGDQNKPKKRIDHQNMVLRKEGLGPVGSEPLVSLSRSFVEMEPHPSAFPQAVLLLGFSLRKKKLAPVSGCAGKRRVRALSSCCPLLVRLWFSFCFFFWCAAWPAAASRSPDLVLLLSSCPVFSLLPPLVIVLL